jgi:hypothetical protein
VKSVHKDEDNGDNNAAHKFGLAYHVSPWYSDFLKIDRASYVFGLAKHF